MIDGDRPPRRIDDPNRQTAAGEKAGSKLATARQLGVPVLSEDQFEALIKRTA